MTKERFNFRAAYERMSEIKARLAEMTAALEADQNRDDLTDAEKGEKRQLDREMAILEMKIKANTPTYGVSRDTHIAEAEDSLRQMVREGKRFELRISRAVASSFGGNVSGYAEPAATTNPAGITIGDIVEPLYNRTILSAIGSPLLTGLTGNYQWPVVEAFEATINDEGAALGDTRIPVSKLIAKPERIGVAVPITREALNETDGLLQTVCTQYMPVAVAELMNKIMFSTTAVTGATNLKGPFITTEMKSGNKKTYTGDAPTLADLLALKGAVLGSNIIGDGLCYVMNETMKALLEGTPKWANSHVSIVDENGKINGIPVFTTNHVANDTVHLGAFKYAPQGLFGDMTLIVDPYTQARKNAIDFVLNVDYAISVLRKDAFATLTKTA